MRVRRAGVGRAEPAGAGVGTSRGLFTRPFVSLLVANAGFGYAFSSFLLIPKFLAVELSAGPATIGLVSGVTGACAVVFLVVMGAAVDRLGRRPFLTAGAVLMAIASLAFASVDAMGPLVFILRGLQALAFAMAFAGGSALAVDVAPSGRLGQAIGLYGLTFLSMNAIAPAVVETLADARGWPWAFAAAAAGAALCALLSRLVPEQRGSASHPGSIPGIRDVALRPRQLRIAAVIAVVGAALGSVFTFGQPFALDLGMGQVRSLFVAYTLAAMAARLALGPFVDRTGPIRVSILALLLYGFVLIGMMHLGAIGLAPLGALLGVAHGLFYPSFNAVALEGAEESERGKVMSLFQGWFNVGLATGTFALGFLAEVAGYPAVYLVTGVATFGALAFLVLSPEGRLR